MTKPKSEQNRDEVDVHNNAVVVMFRTYTINNGDYVSTDLTIHGPKGRAIIADLTPSEQRALTLAGINRQ